MLELDEDRRRPVPEADPSKIGAVQERRVEPTMHEQATDEHATRLTDAAAQLHEAIEELNRVFLGGSPIEKDSARGRFDIALAAYAALLDAL